MRIGVITLQDDTNYGNRLQNIAVETYLRSLGVEAETIRFLDESYAGSSWKHSMKRMFPVFRKKKIPKAVYQRKQRFDSFSNQYLHFSEIQLTGRKTAEKAALRFNGICVGSDQVWNPYWGACDATFAAFVPPEKRFSFSASMGVTFLPQKLENRFRQRLLEMQYISVREKNTAKVIERLTGRTADVFLDPTMLVPVEMWKSMMKKPECDLPDRYLVSFFYGNHVPAEKQTVYQEYYRCDAVTLNHPAYPVYYCLDPAEMLYVLFHSQVVLTDSFHGVVFSILFHKQFIVFRRSNNDNRGMFIRLEELLYEFQLWDRMETDKGIMITDLIRENRFQLIDRKLREEEIRTRKILTGVLRMLSKQEAVS